MTIIGNHWHSMTEEERQPFVELAKEEAKQYEREKALMERAQRPNEMWQPIRRCLMVKEWAANRQWVHLEFHHPDHTIVTATGGPSTLGLETRQKHPWHQNV